MRLFKANLWRGWNLISSSRLCSLVLGSWTLSFHSQCSHDCLWVLTSTSYSLFLSIRSSSTNSCCFLVGSSVTCDRKLSTWHSDPLQSCWTVLPADRVAMKCPTRVRAYKCDASFTVWRRPHLLVVRKLVADIHSVLVGPLIFKLLTEPWPVPRQICTPISLSHILATLFSPITAHSFLTPFALKKTCCITEALSPFPEVARHCPT